MIRHILSEVQKFGLSPDQELFIQLSLTSDGVKIPEAIRKTHGKQGFVIFAIKPGEYENMLVTEYGLKVDLGFDGIAETVFIPFSSIATFSDPSANFSLTLEPEYENNPVTFQMEIKQLQDASDNVIIFPKQ